MSETVKQAKLTKNTSEYMREYKKAKYHEDIEGARAYRNSLRYKKRFEIPNEDFDKYGKHLATIVKLRQIVDTLPLEFLKEIVEPKFATLE